MTTRADDACRMPLLACLFATIREGRFAAITAVVNPSRRPETQPPTGHQDRCLFPSPMHGPMSQAQDGLLRTPAIRSVVLLA